LHERAPNKTALQQRFGLTADAEPLLFAVISRMAWQKGLDLLADTVPALVGRDAQLAVLGTGDPELERRLTTLAHEHRGQVGCIVGYDEDLAHLIQAGADAVLVPSRFEPCGLTQLCAMRYGAMPIVAKVGGLADTVVDLGQGRAETATGLQFFPVTREALEAALHRAVDLWSNRMAWQSLQSNAMQADVSWAEPAAEFFRLYSQLLAAKN
jgi:starch synthase